MSFINTIIGSWVPIISFPLWLGSALDRRALEPSVEEAAAAVRRYRVVKGEVKEGLLVREALAERVPAQIGNPRAQDADRPRRARMARLGGARTY